MTVPEPVKQSWKNARDKCQAMADLADAVYQAMCDDEQATIVGNDYNNNKSGIETGFTEMETSINAYQVIMT